ncbi:MAG: branched-chain-amino-acid transaminase [Akkermansia sp.]|nr:branched-chain-amino-acid transaminase [Akkermansia sp.]
MKIWFDGKLVDREEAKVSVFDHGVLYGDGCFEGIRFYSGKIFRLEEHIVRLFNSMRYLMLELPWSFEEVCKATEETVAASGMEDGYIRLVVTRGKGDLGLNPRNCPKASMFIIVQNIALYPKEMYENGLSMITSSYRRPNPDVLCQQVKSLNYLNGISAKIEAVQQGAGEALMLNQRGNVAECTGDNIFIITNGVVATPPLTECALGGITRHAVMDICTELGIPCVEKVLNRFDVLSADECFLTGTAAEVIAATSLDGRTIGTGQAGPITKRILARYQQLVRE